MKSLMIIYVLIVVTVLNTNSAIAIQCDTVLNNIYNLSSLNSVSTAFSNFKQDICSSEFEEFSSAQTSRQKIGIDVPGYFTGRYGSATTADNYRQRRSEFCSLTLEQFASGDALSTVSSTIEQTTVDAWRQCVLASQRSFSILVVPSSDNATFTVRLAKRDPVDPSFEINGWSFAPNTQVNSCEAVGIFVDGVPAKSGPVNIPIGDATLICSKNTQLTTTFAISTTGGNFDTQLIGTTDELFRIRQQLSTITGQIDALKSSVVPKGSLASMNLDHCPNGWVEADGTNGIPDLRGRVAIGVGPLPSNTGNLSLGESGGAHRYKMMVLNNQAACCEGDATAFGVGIEWENEGRSLAWGNRNFSGGLSDVRRNSFKYADDWQTHLPPFVALRYCVKI